MKKNIPEPAVSVGGTLVSADGISNTDATRRVDFGYDPDELPLFRNGAGVVKFARYSDEMYDRLTKQAPKLQSFHVSCPTCGGTQDDQLWVFENGDFGRWVADYPEDNGWCNCRLQWNLRMAYRKANIPVQFYSKRFGGANKAESYNGGLQDNFQIQSGKYLENSRINRDAGNSLVFFNGDTKDEALNILLKELVKDGYSCYSTTLDELTNLFVSGWDDEDSKAFYESIMKRDFLLIYGIGSEKGKRSGNAEKHPQRVLQDALSKRLSNNRAVLLGVDVIAARGKTIDEAFDNFFHDLARAYDYDISNILAPHSTIMWTTVKKSDKASSVTFRQQSSIDGSNRLGKVI